MKKEWSDVVWPEPGKIVLDDDGNPVAGRPF